MFSCLQIFVFALFLFIYFFLIYCVSLQECWVDAGSIDVHCVVVVYEFLCGWWCVLNRSGSQQTALITSDTPVSHLRLPRAPAFPACCLPCTSTCEIKKTLSALGKEEEIAWQGPVMRNLLFAAVVRKCVVSSGLGSILILKTLACYSSLCNHLKSFLFVLCDAWNAVHFCIVSTTRGVTQCRICLHKRCYQKMWLTQCHQKRMQRLQQN